MHTVDTNLLVRLLVHDDKKQVRMPHAHRHDAMTHAHVHYPDSHHQHHQRHADK